MSVSLDGDARQAILFDLEARRFYIFGLVLYPQDFIYLTGLLVILIAAGVLSASYKFKVLAADKAGTDFLIMVDLAHPLPGGASQMTWIEGLIERMAAARHALDVSGVYWRVIDQAVFTPPPPRPRTQLAQRPRRQVTAPAPLLDPQRTGYEDTEQTLPTEADIKNGNLSTTQYGDLH